MVFQKELPSILLGENTYHIYGVNHYISSSNHPFSGASLLLDSMECNCYPKNFGVAQKTELLV